MVFIGIGGSSSSQILTITPPTNGTVSTSKGIICGTLGTNCSAAYANGETVELQVQAAPGFAFSTYTDDCAPGGRTIMRAARTCGATFAPIPEPAPPLMWQLTITQADGRHHRRPGRYRVRSPRFPVFDPVGRWHTGEAGRDAGSGIFLRQIHWGMCPRRGNTDDGAPYL